MPKHAKNYQNGKIYIIRNTKNDKVYVGSTTQPLCKRMVAHRSMAKTNPTGKLYEAFNDLGVDCFYIELLENYPCDNIEQLLSREGEKIREFDAFQNGYNGVIAGRTTQEYQKEYREQNQDKISRYKEAYRMHNKEHILQKAKEYREQHKDTIMQKRKEFYHDNKDSILQKMKEKITCECGCEVRKAGLKEHHNSQKHKQRIECKATP